MNTNAKHTTGPWTLDLLAGLNNMLDPTRPQGAPIMAGDKIVCTIPLPTDSGIDGYEQTANAHLIAAAPALLSALNACLGDLADIVRAEGGDESPAMIQARAALAQAEGGAQ